MHIGEYNLSGRVYLLKFTGFFPVPYAEMNLPAFSPRVSPRNGGLFIFADFNTAKYNSVRSGTLLQRNVILTSNHPIDRLVPWDNLQEFYKLTCQIPYIISI